jgi:hypothetical protein
VNGKALLRILVALSAIGLLSTGGRALAQDGAGDGTASVASGVSVKGVVLDSNGRPIAGAHVDGGPAGMALTVVTTDAKGAFELPPVPLGQILVHAEASGCKSLFEEIDHNGRPLKLFLTKGRKLVVKAKVPGKNVDGTRVTGCLSDASGAQCAYGNVSEGVLELVFDGLAPNQPATLAVRVRGFVPIERKVAGKETQIDLGKIKLDPGHTIKGRVQDPDGYLKEGAASWVSLDFGSYTSLYDNETKLAPDGSFELTGVPAQAAKLHLVIYVPGEGDERLGTTVELDAKKVSRGNLGKIELTRGHVPGTPPR